MKSRLLNNLGLKLLSIFLALIVWLMIMFNQDPEVTRTIRDVPVIKENVEESLTSKGFGYTVESSEMVDIKVTGARSVVDGLSSDDFRATADFMTIDSMSRVAIEIICLSESKDNLVIEPNTDRMLIREESMDDKEVTLEAKPFGDVRENYYLKSANPETVRVVVKGSETSVSKVKKVLADVNLDDMYKSSSDRYELYAVDAEGNKIDSNMISFYVNDSQVKNITVNVTIYEKKEIPVYIDITNNPAEGYYCPDRVIKTMPETLTIAGLGKNLEKIKELRIEESVIGLSESKECIYDNDKIESILKSRYGDTYELVDSNQRLSAKIKIEKTPSRTISITNDDVEIVNGSEEYNYEVTCIPGSYVTVSGVNQEEVDTITQKDLNLYVDVESMTPAQYTLTLNGNYEGTYDIEVKYGVVIVNIWAKNQMSPTG